MNSLREAPAVRKFKKFINDDNKVNNIIYAYILLLKSIKLSVNLI